MVLQAIDPEIEGVPYWDYAVTSPSIFSEQYVGAATGPLIGIDECDQQQAADEVLPDGSPAQGGGLRHAISDGQFAFFPVGQRNETELAELNRFAQALIYPGIQVRPISPNLA